MKWEDIGSGSNNLNHNFIRTHMVWGLDNRYGGREGANVDAKKLGSYCKSLDQYF